MFQKAAMASIKSLKDFRGNIKLPNVCNFETVLRHLKENSRKRKN